MAIQHHPLSNALLGEFIYADTEVIKNGLSPAIFNTRFQYQYGSVTLDSKWQYQTRFNDGDCVIQTEGKHCPFNSRPDLIIMDDVKTEGDSLASRELFSKPFGDKPATMHAYKSQGRTFEEASVTPALDQHSIDGMDDMAFNSRSEADETSTLQGIEYSTTADIDSIKKD